MNKSAIFMVLLPALSACGGGGGGTTGESGSGTDTLTGQFIDSPVQGLKYKTETLSGTTDAEGNFSYRKGEYIQFEMGGLSLGGAPAKAILTPYDVTMASQSADTAALTLSRLLITLDSDNNPDNGIQLKTEAARMGAANLADPTMVQAALSAVLPDTTLVAETTASQHLQSSMTAATAASPMPDGIYQSVLVMNSDDTACTNPYQSISLTMSGGSVSGGTLSRADGSSETLGKDSTGKLVTANGSQVTGLRLYSGSLTGPAVGIEDTNTPLASSAGAGGNCSASFTLKQQGAANEAPFIYQSQAKREQICQYSDANMPNSTTLTFSALDRDGYFSSNMLFTFTIDGKEPTTLIGNWQSPWDDSNKTNQLVSEFTVDKLCGQGFDWKVTVTDNDGTASHAQGRIEAQVEASVTPPATGGGTIAVCLENYERFACESLQSFNATVTINTAGSCPSLIPNPAVTIDIANMPSETDPVWATYPQIQNYPVYSDPVSCYFEPN